MDTDEYFWMPTNPKFTQKRPKKERVELMKQDINKSENVVISGSLTDWGDPEDFGLLVKSTDGKILSSTPCCEWIPYGDSADGAIIVTGWRNVDGTSKTGSDLFISLDMGKTWEALDNPLPYEFPAKHRYGYSPALLTSADKKSVFYMNSVPWEGNTQDRVRGKYAFTKLTLE